MPRVNSVENGSLQHKIKRRTIITAINKLGLVWLLLSILHAFLLWLFIELFLCWTNLELNTTHNGTSAGAEYYMIRSNSIALKTNLLEINCDGPLSKHRINRNRWKNGWKDGIVLWHNNGLIAVMDYQTWCCIKTNPIQMLTHALLNPNVACPRINQCRKVVVGIIDEVLIRWWHSKGHMIIMMTNLRAHTHTDTDFHWSGQIYCFDFTPNKHRIRGFGSVM